MLTPNGYIIKKDPGPYYFHFAPWFTQKQNMLCVKHKGKGLCWILHVLFISKWNKIYKYGLNPGNMYIP